VSFIVGVLGTRGVGGNEQQVDGLVVELSSILAFRRLRGAAGELVAAGRCPAPSELISRVVDQPHVEVFAEKVSPLVDLTSNTPSPISRIEMSKVPPRGRQTAMVCLPSSRP
jgi:hypothetical protein